MRRSIYSSPAAPAFETGFSSAGGTITYDVPVAQQTAWGALVEDDKFILAFTVPEAITALNISGGSIDFGDLAVAGGTVVVSNPTPLNITGGEIAFGALAVSGGAVTVSALPPPTPLNISGGVVTFGALAVAGGAVTVAMPTALNISGGTVTFSALAVAGGTVVIAPPTPLNISGGAVTFGALAVAGGAVEVVNPTPTPLNITGGAVTFDALAVAGGTVTIVGPTPLNVSGGAITLGAIAITGGAVVIVTVAPDREAFLDSPADGSYEFRVRARSSDGYGEFGQSAAVRVGEVVPTIVPLNITGGAITFGTLVVRGGTLSPRAGSGAALHRRTAL